MRTWCCPFREFFPGFSGKQRRSELDLLQVAQFRCRNRIVHNTTGRFGAAGVEWSGMGRMGARTFVIASVSMCLLPGTECANAQSAPGEVHTLPPVEVSAPPVSRAKRGRAVEQTAHAVRQAANAARQLRVVYVYPTTPSSGSGS